MLNRTTMTIRNLMQPIPPSLTTTPPAALTLTGNTADLSAWKVGQLLQAQALTGTVNNLITLRIGPTTLEAQTQTPLSAGQTLTVQVVRLGEQPILKVLPQARPILNDPLANALRTSLPKQTGLAPLLANLGLLAQSESAATGVTAPSLPATVLQAAAQIYRALSFSHQAVSADGLQQAIRATGLFLESKLALLARGGSAALETDFKAALLRLQAVLDENTRPAPASPPPSPAGAPAEPRAATPPRTTVVLPPPPLREVLPQAQAASAPTLTRTTLVGAVLDELQQQTEGSLARLQLHQLASVPDSAQAQPYWLLELPLRHQAQVDLFQLRIAHEAPDGPADATATGYPWVVNLAFDLPGLGPVQARVAVLGEQVSTTFWAEQANTTQAFRRHLEMLRRNLQQAGLAVGDLACRTGQAPQSPTGPRVPLMDTRA